MINPIAVGWLKIVYCGYLFVSGNAQGSPGVILTPPAHADHKAGSELGTAFQMGCESPDSHLNSVY
jgi:hypothetical protein